VNFGLQEKNMGNETEQEKVGRERVSVVAIQIKKNVMKGGTY